MATILSTIGIEKLNTIGKQNRPLPFKFLMCLVFPASTVFGYSDGLYTKHVPGQSCCAKLHNAKLLLLPRPVGGTYLKIFIILFTSHNIIA